MFIDFREKREGRERSIDVTETHQLVASLTRPNGELNSQPRHVPWLGIEPPAFWCMGRHSNQLSHWPAQLCSSCSKLLCLFAILSCGDNIHLNVVVFWPMKKVYLFIYLHLLNFLSAVFSSFPCKGLSPICHIYPQVLHNGILFILVSNFLYIIYIYFYIFSVRI